jgi:hypothetical protein
MINYSAIPEAKDPDSPWGALKVAVIVTFSLLGIMGLGAIVTAFTGQRDMIMTSISGVLLLGFIGIVIGAFVRGHKGFDEQKQWMRQFAKDNGWLYDESKRTVNDFAPFPPLYTTLAANWNNVRCTVSGELHGMRFELAHITYLQSNGLIGKLSSNIGRSKFAWTSVLRVEGRPDLHESPNFVYEIDGPYTYVICGLNALYRDDIQVMFESVASVK